MTMLSESADPKKYYWMRYASDRATSVTVKGEKVRIVKGDLFGVREVKGKEDDEVMLLNNVVFRLSIPKSEVLMNRSKEYKGAIKSPKTLPAKPAPKAASPKAPVDAKFANLAHKYGGYTLSAFRDVLRTLKTEQEQIAFKKWMLSKLDSHAAAYKAIQGVIIGSKRSPIKAVIQLHGKPTVTKYSVMAHTFRQNCPRQKCLMRKTSLTTNCHMGSTSLLVSRAVIRAIG